MKRVLVDADGVLLDFVGALCKELTIRGHVLTPEDVKHWELKESLTLEALRMAYSLMGESGFCDSIPWYEDALSFLSLLVHENDVHVLTAPSAGSTWMHERKASFSRVGFPWQRVHFVDGKFKHIVSGDILIEDHPGTAARWLQEHRSGTAILIDRPWNQPSAAEYAAHHRMYRVKSYAEALTTIRECL